MTSQLENYHSTIQDQELVTKYLKNKKARESGKTPDCSNKCRLCNTNVVGCSICQQGIIFP